MLRLSKQNIKSICLRVYNNMNFNGADSYKELLRDPKVVNYFKRIHKFVEYPGIRKFLSRSRFYDKKFMQIVEEQANSTKDKFFENIRTAQSLYSKRFDSSYNQSDLDYICKMLDSQVFCDTYSYTVPTIDEVIQKQNSKASVGLPTPWLKKGQLVTQFRNVLTLFYEEKLDMSTLLKGTEFFSGAFKRSQVTDSGLKVRLVFAVNHIIACLESYFDMCFKRILRGNENCNFIHGFSQSEISTKVSEFKSYHCYSFDVSGFDHSIPRDVLTIAFSIMDQALSLTMFETKIFKWLRNYFITLPVFHPECGYVPRQRGLSSGSGYTSSIGSLCMFSMHCVVIKKYCELYNIDIDSLEPKIVVSSDDSMLGLSSEIDALAYTNLMLKTFDVKLELEHYSPTGVDVAFFLGSQWVDGSPTRDIKRMFGRILFGSGNFPKMSPEILFASRCFDILGNVSNFNEIWTSFHIRNFPRRIFRFKELGDYTTQLKLRSLMSKHEHRGLWINTSSIGISLDSVWATR
jgi:hypothetical protein